MNTDKLFAEALAKEYAPKDSSKLIALQKLDRRAKLPAAISAYGLGIFSALIFGAGMCLCMGLIGGTGAAWFVAGVLAGLAGLAGAAVNYPIFKRLSEKGKQRYAFEILELAREISRET